jgi:predicted dehydrogenase
LTVINVGVIGLGMMGLTHLDVYSKRSDVKVVAISDQNRARLEGKERATGNVEGQAKGGFDYSRVRKYPEGMDLITDDEVDLVDICLPTPKHVDFAVAVLAAGKHMMVEKPVARSSDQLDKLIKAAEHSQKLSMVGMCMRFWPGWTWLKEAIERKTYGSVRSANFRRLASLPPGPMYADGKQSGGAILDLHIHDVDFVQYCFGMSKAVTSAGYVGISGAIDHVITHYHYDNIPLVVAEGGWTMDAGFPFTMEFIVRFERATAVFSLAGSSPLMLYQEGKPAQAVPVEPGMGYEREIAYFLDCIQSNRKPQTVTIADAAKAIRIVEAEVKSAESGRTVQLKPDGSAM